MNTQQQMNPEEGINAIEKSNFQILAKYPAGIIATSLGKGKKLDSKTIIIKISVYPIWPRKSLIISIIACIVCNILFVK